MSEASTGNHALTQGNAWEIAEGLGVYCPALAQETSSLATRPTAKRIRVSSPSSLRILSKISLVASPSPRKLALHTKNLLPPLWLVFLPSLLSFPASHQLLHCSPLSVLKSLNHHHGCGQLLHHVFHAADLPRSQVLPARSRHHHLFWVEAAVGSSSHRVRKRLAWMSDYEVTGIDQYEDPLTHFALFSYYDPTSFESAVKESKWRKAMDAEIAAITKLKENGEVDKYKAPLVAKGYKQEFGVDYKEVFAPVARHDTIRLVIALATQNSWPIFQLDVKSAFLHGNLEEQVFVDQSPGYIKVKNEHKVYRLKKALYGLKQAPRAWFQMKDCNPVSTPTQFGLKLNKDHGGKKVDSIIYKQIVELHFLAAKKICRYLQGTKDFGLFYKKGKRGCSWSSKKQPIVTLSTTEAEFVAATTCACQAIWLRKILEELHLKQVGATTIFVTIAQPSNSPKIPCYMEEASILT
ncbi:Retrovirus-related Pol polyprotein from transposon RE2 [Vitis vinifera]|uniref:Retrovirus-related Pol polyprotein from transposon RE2 n=1 Tax=Vitis vinifera TaxID=29760 RepID=A0A438C7M9_VITVI|nr:Retrovirus-related Pol polyprotein from transposon RE2 [Vitis vinifera]